MPDYTPPTSDMLYVLGELLDAEGALRRLPGHEEVSLALLGDLLAEAGRFCSEVARPLNQPGDRHGCVLENGVVRTPPGFADAYRAFVAAGWPALSHARAHGGHGLPQVAQLLVDEMLASANFSFGLFPGLTRGAVEVVARHGDEALRAAFLPRMVSGEWTGIMALTEAHAGTDLGLLRTRAEPLGNGQYRVSGAKIFISAGDHDLAGNIVHLVLARLPDALAGVRGISLFLVPKFLPDDAGEAGERNGVQAIGLERKMGIHASPTCAISYDGALGWMVGEPGRGLQAMFTMMNAERLFVGVQGLGIAEAAYQAACAYARERLQGRHPGVSEGGPHPILGHPDVRRMLLTMRAFTEAGRALAVWLSLEIEAAFTDLGFEAAVLGQQVLGGHGYVREWGLEQFVRDARVAQIYEGTNGVQAMDLVGRKLFADGSAAFGRFSALVRGSIEASRVIDGAQDLSGPMAEALGRLDASVSRLREAAARDPSAPGAAAADLLRLLALVALGWMWLRMGVHALSLGEAMEARHRGKLAVARFFMARMLPQTAALAMGVAAAPEAVMALPAEAF